MTDQVHGVAGPTENVAPPLVQYYEGLVSVAGCVKALKSGGPDLVPIDVMHSLLVRLPVLDPDLVKTGALVKSQMSRGEPLSVLRQWLHLVVLEQGAVPGGDGSAVNQVERLLVMCLPAKGKPGKRAQQLLKLAILDLRWSRGLPGDQLAGVFANHLVQRRESDEALERHGFAYLLRNSTASQLRPMARVLAWLFRLSAAQATELALARSEIATLQDRRGRLEAEVRAGVDQVAGLQREIEEQVESRRALEQRIRDERDTATIRFNAMTGRISGKLNGRVGPLLTQASDALTMSEPSIRAAQEFISTAQDAIEEAKAWLAAESTSERPTA